MMNIKIYIHIYVVLKLVNDAYILLCSIGSSSGQQHTQKTVALAVGGFAALGFLTACLLFVKSVFKKRSTTKY